MQKRYRQLISFLAVILLITACKDDDSPNYSDTNINRNQAYAYNCPNAQSLEIPHLDAETGHVLTHTVDYKGLQVINYTVDWHPDKRHSKWVAFIFTSTTGAVNWNRNNWENTSWGGDPFQPDPDLSSEERTELSDYYRSGYDRGHLCASADRLFCQDANEQTFHLSNMSPQIGRFNQQDWVDLEGLVQNWGRSNSFRDTLFVVKGGTIKDDQIMTYTKSGIPVPQYYFMALLCKKSGTYKTIGFWVEHKSYGGNPTLSSWVVSIDELEEKTGIDFFCNLPDRIETPVEQNYNIGEWPGLK